MPVYNAPNNYQWAGNGYAYPNAPAAQAPVQMTSARWYSEPQYVTGIEGANAFQMPPGVTQIFLWDTDKDCFYIKKLDEMGRPRVVAWKDFSDHVEPEASKEPPAKYMTKDDLNEMLGRIDLSGFMTKNDFTKAIERLKVDENGKVVMG